VGARTAILEKCHDRGQELKDIDLDGQGKNDTSHAKLVESLVLPELKSVCVNFTDFESLTNALQEIRTKGSHQAVVLSQAVYETIYDLNLKVERLSKDPIDHRTFQCVRSSTKQR